VKINKMMLNHKMELKLQETGVNQERVELLHQEVRNYQYQQGKSRHQLGLKILMSQVMSVEEPPLGCRALSDGVCC
jgi:hypothetical protein